MKRVLLFAVALSLAMSLAAFGQPREGGTLTIAMEYDPSTLDPLAMTDMPAGNVFTHVVEALFRLGPDGDLEYILAKDYEASADGMEWTIYLREGVEFHDGTPFNAEAAKWNLDRFREEATFAFLLYAIGEIEAVDEYTLKIYLDEAYAPLLRSLGHTFTGILSPAAVEAGADYPVGTGPFEYVSWTRGDQLVLERNPEYWGEGPYVDRLVFKPVPEPGTRVMMLLTGEIDLMTRVPPDDVPVVEAESGAEVVVTASLSTQYIGMNCQRGPLADPLVRRALNYGIDKQEIVDYVEGGFAMVADAPIAPAVFGHYPAGPYPYDPEKARELLAQAGYPDGFQTTLRYNPGWREMAAEVIQAQLRRIGVEAELIAMEWGSYLDFTARPVEVSEVDIYMLGWTTVTGDADYALYALLHGGEWTPAGSNRSFYKNEMVDTLLNMARQAAAPGVREAMYAAAIQLIWDDAPWVFLMTPENVHGARTNVRDAIHHPNGYILAYTAWLE